MARLWDILRLVRGWGYGIQQQAPMSELNLVHLRHYRVSTTTESEP